MFQQSIYQRVVFGTFEIDNIDKCNGVCLDVSKYMKKLITIIFVTLTIFSVQGQELDPKYYLFGFSFDYSIPTYPGTRLEMQKLNTWIHESDTGRVLRLSEVTKRDYKKRKAQKDCRNCQEYYELKNIPWYLGEFYNFTYVKKKGSRPKQVTGKVKNEVINNASDLQMKSFLAGIFNAYGSIVEDTVKFQFGHVDDKLKITEKFIGSLDGGEFMKIIPIEKGMFGGGPRLLLVPKGALKEILATERKRIDTLANKTYLK